MSRFLVPYMQYVAQRTDAPAEFGHAAGLVCLSGVAMGRRWLTSGLHPNLYTLLVGPSSRDRKSTSIGLAMDILEEVEPQRVGPNDFTSEGLVARMRTTKTSDPEAARMVIPIPEFGTYLAAGKKSYMAGASTLLCQLYDGDTVSRARAKDTLMVKHPRVSLIAGCAHGMLEKYVEGVDWEGGFFARMLFVLGKTKTHDFSRIPSRNEAARDVVRAALIDISNVLKAIPGPHVMTAEADQHYEEYIKSIPDHTGDQATVAQRERLLNTIPKLALLYQIDDNPSAPIGMQAVQAAIAFTQHAWESFKYAYGLSAGSTKTKLAKRVWKKISNSQERIMRRRDVLRAFTINLGELLPVIDELKKLGAITEYAKDGSQVYFAKVEYTEDDNVVDAGGADDSAPQPPVKLRLSSFSVTPSAAVSPFSNEP